MLHSHSPLPREPFHLKQSVVETVRTLPTTIIYMAAATLVSSLMFHFTDNLINVSIVYILAIILHARATSCYGAGIIAAPRRVSGRCGQCDNWRGESHDTSKSVQ